MISARLIAEGRVEREAEHAEVPITHLICRGLIDRSDLLDGPAATESGDDRGACVERAPGRADEVRRPKRSSATAARLLRSRDFR